MNIIRIRRLYLRPDEGLGDPGASAPPVAPPAEPAQAPAAPASEPSMSDVMFGALEGREYVRDDQGRFAQKAVDPAAPAVPAPPAAPVAVAPATPVAKPAIEPPKPPAEEHPDQMPEGLTPKAQQRFQQLANERKELQADVAALQEQVSYVKETFAQHAITQQQFESMAGYVGAINKGDLRGALQMLDQQREALAQALGESLPGVDLFRDFPDLRAAIEAGQTSEQHAAEIAKYRRGQAAQQQFAQRQQVEQQQTQQSQAVQQRALLDVDSFCKSKQASDMDYAAIEAQLVPVLPKLLKGVPPTMWKDAVETQYSLLKQVAASTRSSHAATSGTVLRGTGASSPKAEPKDMFEAMFGARA